MLASTLSSTVRVESTWIEPTAVSGGESQHTEGYEQRHEGRESVRCFALAKEDSSTTSATRTSKATSPSALLTASAIVVGQSLVGRSRTACDRLIGHVHRSRQESRWLDQLLQVVASILGGSYPATSRLQSSRSRWSAHHRLNATRSPSQRVVSANVSPIQHLMSRKRPCPDGGEPQRLVHLEEYPTSLALSIRSLQTELHRQ